MPRYFAIIVGPLILPVVMPLVARSACDDEAASAWLRLAREQAVAVEDAAARSHLFARIAVGAARLGDEVSYRRDIERAVASMALAPEKPELSPVDSAIAESIPSLIALRAKAGDAAGAKALAEQNLKGREPYRPVWMGTIAAAQAEAGDFDGAVATARSIGSFERVDALVRVAAALARRNDSRAMRIAEMLDGERPTGRSDAYKAIALAHAGAGRHAEAVANLEKIDDEGIMNASRADIAEKLAQAGDFEVACALVASVPRGLPRDLAYYRVVLAQLDLGKIAGAKLTAAKVESAAHRAQLFGAIARAEALSGHRDDARRTAESIPEGDRERLAAFRALVAAAVQANDFDGAVRIAEGQAEFEWLADIAAAAIDRRREAEARRIVDRLHQIGRDQPVADNRFALRLAILQARLGNPNAFDRMAGDLEANLRARRDPDDRKQLEAMLFGLYVGAGRIGEARRLVREKSARDIDIMIAWTVAAFSASGDLKRAEELTFLLPTPRARESYIAGLAAAHRKAGGDAVAIAWIGRLTSPYDRATAYLGLADPSLSR